MAATVPPGLKGADIAQFAHRAQQLEKFKPIITYWRACCTWPLFERADLLQCAST
jgi:hypothetical protein